ncbi:MAG: hypothetical protein ACK5S5_03075 [Planctomycetota bacterium]|jgi:hypothetical protein
MSLCSLPAALRSVLPAPLPAMLPAILPLALSAALAAPLAAQSCFVGDFGASLGYGTTDTVYPIRPTGSRSR